VPQSADDPERTTEIEDGWQLTLETDDDARSEAGMQLLKVDASRCPLKLRILPLLFVAHEVSCCIRA